MAQALTTPEVSVVMSVFNGASTLAPTLRSVLSQESCDFEFIVVNDGSTDASSQILDEFASREPRLRVIHQENTGLTRALIRGCGLARAKLIARQDCGDLALPGRLTAQTRLLREQPRVVLTCVGNRVVGPKGEWLFDVVRDGRELDHGLAQLQVERLKGPTHHGATMFRHDAYVRAGGYRPQWVVAQDVDLWLRLAELGECTGSPVIGYQSQLELAGISSRRRAEQLQLCQLAIECAQLRRSGRSDSERIDTYLPLPIQPKRPIDDAERARFLYFIGSCLRVRDRVAAKPYFRESLSLHPWSLRTWYRRILG